MSTTVTSALGAPSPHPYGTERAGTGRTGVVLCVAGLMLVAGALRLPFLGDQSLWYDEVVTAGLVDRSLGDMLAAIPDSESTPPLYYIVLWLWSRVLGTGDAALRSLSAAIGILTVPAVYAAGANLVGRRAGLVAAALAAVSPILVWYSLEVRAYALLVLLSALVLASFAVARDSDRAGPLVAWAAASAGALATHYFALFLVAPTAVWLLARSPTRGRALAACLAVAAAGAALMPLALHQRDHGGADFIAELPFATRIGQIPKQFLVGYDAPGHVALAIASAALVALAVWLLVARGDPRERRGATVAAALAAATLALALLAALVGFDYVLTRNLLPAWPALAVVVAAGLGARRAGWLGLGAAAVVCAMWAGVSLAVALDDRYQRTDWAAVAAALGPAPPEGRAISLTPGSGRRPLERYLGPLRPVPPEGVPVRELALVAANEGQTGQTTPPPPAKDPGPPVELGMQIVRRLETPTFSMILYRSTLPEPPRLFADGLAAFRLSRVGTFQTLVQEPAGAP